MKKTLFILAFLLFILTSCEKSIEYKPDDKKKIELSVNKMVQSTLKSIIESNLTEQDLINSDTIFKIVQHYDPNVVLIYNQAQRIKSNVVSSEEVTLSDDQIQIVTKLELMGAEQKFDFSEIRNDISSLPFNEQELVSVLLAVVEGGVTAIDTVINENIDAPLYMKGANKITKARLTSILCGAATGGLGTIYGMWSGAIVGAYYGTMAGGFIGTGVGIISGAILSAYVCPAATPIITK